MPPAPVPSSQPRSWHRPRAQPPRTSGKVSQLGTLSFQPSMTAATIMATQTKRVDLFGRPEGGGEFAHRVGGGPGRGCRPAWVYEVPHPFGSLATRVGP